MKTKRLLSFGLTIVLMAFTLLNGVNVYAVSKSVIKAQITTSTNYVLKAEKLVNGAAYDIKQAQAMVITAQTQVKKISNYGSGYKTTYTALTKRLNAVTSKINTKVKALALAAAQAKQNISAAENAVAALEKLTNVSNKDMVSNDTTVTNIKNAVKTAQDALGKLPVDSTEYIDLMARVEIANTKLTTAINEKAAADKAASDAAAAAAIKAKYAAEAAVSRVELAMNIDIDKAVKSSTFIDNTKKLISSAKTAVGKLDYSSQDYKNLMSKINDANAKLKDIVDKKAAAEEEKLNQEATAAAEKAVSSVENSKLSTASDIKIVLDLENVATLAIGKIKDQTTAAGFTNRIKNVDQKAKAFQAKLDADALAAKTPAKIMSVSAVDKAITVNFDKKPLTTVTAGDFKVSQSIRGVVTSTALSSVTVINATTIRIAVQSIAPIANVDQSVVYSVKYQGQAAINAGAFVVAKIPYLMVVSATAINLKQIKIVFSKSVDKTSAETIGNYLENGIPMNASYEKAELQSDKQSVIITYAAQKAQQSTITFTAMNVKNDTYTETLASANFSINFMDVTPPAVTSVVSNGNYSVTINYSEPVNGANVASAYRMDGNDISGYGVTGISYDDNVYPMKQTSVTITFGAMISNGTHSFSVLPTRVSDFANYYVPATSTPITVVQDTSKPTVISGVAVGSGILDLTFNKAVALPSVYNLYVNGIQLDSSAIVRYKDVNDKTVIEVVKAGLLVNGPNLITIARSTVYDLNGNTNDTSEIRFNVIATTAYNYTTSTVNSVTTVNSRQLEVFYSAAMNSTAMYTGYYVLKDSYGNIISSITSVTQVSASSYAYYLNLGTALPVGTYTLTITGVTDIYGNIITPVVKTIVITSVDSTLPLAPTAYMIDSVYKKVQVNFSEPMSYATIANISNYKIAIAGLNSVYVPLDSTVLITPSADYRSVILDFPDNTNIVPGVTLLETLYLRDLAGNCTANGIDANIAIGGAASLAPAFLRASVINPTQILVEYNKALSSVAANDFYLSGIVAQSANPTTATVYNFDNVTQITGTKIILTFPTGVISSTTAGTLSVFGPVETMDSSGNRIAIGTLSTSIINKISPNIVSVKAVNTSTIDIVFSSNILTNMALLSKNDFSVTNGGVNVPIASSQVVNGNTVELLLSTPLLSNQLTVLRPIAKPNYTQDVNNNLYVPSQTDLLGLTVNLTTVVNNPTIGNNDSGKLQVGTDVQAAGASVPATGQTITWTSDNPSVATVNVSGLVHPLTAGTATISYKVTDSTSIVVASGTRSITVYGANTEKDPSYGMVQVGQQTATLPIAGSVPTLSGTQTIAWSCINTDIATVDNNGAVTPKLQGNATIIYTISDGGFVIYNGHVTLTVQAPTIMKTLNIPNVQLGGTPSTVSPSVMPTTVAGQSIAWSSDNVNIASVNGNGLVSPIGVGTANITYVITDDASHIVLEKGSGSVTVLGAAINNPPTGLNAISYSSVTKTTVLTAPLSINGQNIAWNIGDITWTSSDPTLATVAQTSTNTATVTVAASLDANVVATLPQPVTISYTVKNSSNIITVKGSFIVTITP